MSRAVALIIVPDIARAYDFGKSHPLRPERVLGTYQRIHDLELIDGSSVREISARVATDEEILAVHDEDFVATVKAVDEGARPGRAIMYGLGTPDNPIFNNMHGASAAVCGASITGVDLILSREVDHAFNPAGGLHHARRMEASGFCIYNDPAAAIAKVLAVHPDWRVMYVDVDVHHGDGVQWIFYDEPRVLTVSLHQSGRFLYPGTGFEGEIGENGAEGTSINVPLPPYTGQDDYLWALEQVVPAAAERFKPNLLVTVLGADTHWGDPLANLGLTMSAYPRMAEILHNTAHEHCENRMLATGGGGYQAETVVPEIWSIHFAEMCGRPEVVPPRWFEDRPSEEVSQPYRDDLEDMVSSVLGQCLPRLEALVSS